MSTPKTSDRRWAAAAHVGAMILTVTGATIFSVPAAILISLVLMFAIGEKGSFINNQMREVARFQFMTALYVIGGTFAVIGIALLTGANTVVAVGGFALMFGMFAMLILGIALPLIAAINTLKGKDYAYPLVFSPRRKAFQAADEATASDSNADDASANTPDDGDEDTRC